jgi:hypothetical protein
MPSTPHNEGDGKAEGKKKMVTTPRLEDFGVSSYTLNLVNKRTQQTEPNFKVPAYSGFSR